MKNVYDVLGREPVHPFPARMAPGIAADVMRGVHGRKRVLDPMMGSGTVVALARAYGHRGLGFDIDPLAVMITGVWTTAVRHDLVRDAASDVLTRAGRRFRDLAVRDAYPAAADAETRAFVRYWFDGYCRRQLTALSEAIHDVHDATVRDALWCAFSRLIITKQAGVSLAMDLSHSRPHRAFDVAPVKPFSNFRAAVERVVGNCLEKRQPARGPHPDVREGDARALPLPSESVDLVVTSPPYLNAIDYMRCSKFSLVWMGYSLPRLRRLRTESIGTEAGAGHIASDIAEEAVNALDLQPRLAERERRILLRYVDDMGASLREVSRVLAPRGKAVYVVGENTVRGTYIRNADIVCSVARSYGLQMTERHVRDLPANRRYLPPPAATASGGLDGRMRREVVVSLTKS